jgi:two-component system response regulator ResD
MEEAYYQTVEKEVFTTRGFRILVVDDEPSVRRAIRMLLEHSGHQIWEADGGAAALRQLTDHSFDLVITDYLMPGMNGDQLVARIRKLLPAQSIILATAFPEEFQTLGDPAGKVDALLIKPFTLTELHAAIQQVLTRPPLSRPNFI